MVLVKNLKVVEYIKKESVLIIALFLAITTSFIYTPKMEYIDFKTLILLFNLMIIVSAFKKLKFLDYIAVAVVKKCSTYKHLSVALVFITFFASMLVTNDVALITFVPITMIIGSKLDIDVLKIVVFQTLAANLGSSLTPMGNPQNLFTYTYYNISPIRFFQITVPIALMSILFLIMLIFKSKNKVINISIDKVIIGDRKKLITYSILLVIILFSVFHVIDYKLSFLLTLLFIFFMDRKLFFEVDYSLLITFIGFFIFVGNISNSIQIQNFMKTILSGESNTYYAGIIISQFISNVPAAMLLSGFTENFNDLILGVNIGGMGTLIASMASVISYKLYCTSNNESRTRYLRVFTMYNILGLALFTILFKFILYL